MGGVDEGVKMNVRMMRRPPVPSGLLLTITPGALEMATPAAHGCRAASTWVPRWSFGARGTKKPPARSPAALVWSMLSRIPGVPRFSPGFWEAAWPRIQVEGARYGLSGGAVGGSLLLLKFNLGVSVFLVDFLPFSWHASAGATGGLVATAATTAAVVGVDRVFSLHPEGLQRLCFSKVAQDFFVERALGGAVELGPSLTYRVTPAELYLTERKTPGFLKNYAFRPGSVEAVFRVQGPDGGASVLCEGKKTSGGWHVRTLAIEFDSPQIVEEKRLLVLTTDKSDQELAVEPIPRPLQRAAEMHVVSEGGGAQESGDASGQGALKLRSLLDIVWLRS